MKNLNLLNLVGREKSYEQTRMSRNSLDSIVSRFSLVSLICLCMLTIGVGQAWGADVDVSFSSWVTSIQNYNETEWTDNGCTFTYASNNQTNWAYVRCGCKGGSSNSASTSGCSIIKYNSQVNIPVESVILSTTNGITNGSSSSITITGIEVSAYSNSTMTTLVSSKNLGTLSYTSSNCPTSITITPTSSWATGLYYKITISWTAVGKKNSGLNISSIKFKEVSCTSLGSINGSVTLSQLATPNPTKLKATWSMNATTGIASYDLEVYNSSNVKVKTINNYTSGDEITGLDPCTTYYVKLYTVSSGSPYCDGGLIGTSSTCTTNGYTLTVTKSNVSLASGSEPSNICSNVSATYSASVGYVLPSTITVTNAGAQNTGWTWNSSTGVLTINKASVTGNVTVTITGVEQGCSGQYTFAYGATPNADGKNIDGATKECFSQVGETTEYQITGFTIPTTTQYYWVGYNGSFYNDGLGSNNASSSRNQFKYMPVANLQGSSCGGTSEYYKHAAAGAYGTLRIYSNYSDNNLYVGFSPAGYQMRIGSGDSWTNVQLTQDGSTWTSDLVTLDAATVAKKYYINVWTGSSYSSSDPGVAINNWTDGNSTISSMVFKTGADTWNTTSGLSAGMRGKFRTWTDNCANNGYCHFVPYYRITYNGSGADGSTTASTDVSCEGNAAARTVQAAANGFTVPTGKSFGGWASSPENAAAGTVAYAAGADVVLTQSIVLYAIWTDIDYMVTVNQSPAAGATTTGQTSSAHYNGTINLTTTVPSGYRFVNWTTSDGFSISNNTSPTTASFTMPAKNVTVTANFQAIGTITWMVGGSAWDAKTQTADVGTTISDPGTPDVPASCSGKVFVGWSETPIVGTATTTKPSDLFITPSGTIPAGGKTYHAVFASYTGTYGKFKRVTTSSIATDIAAGQQIAIVAYDAQKDNLAWKILGTNAAGNAYADDNAPTETSDKINEPADRFIWKISKDGDYWVFTNKSATTKKIAASSTSSNSTLNISTQTYYKWAYGTNSAGTNTFYLRQYGSSSLTSNGLERYGGSWKVYNGDYTTSQAFQLKLYVPAYTIDDYITTCSTDPTLSVTPTSLAFGSVPTNETKDLTFTLSGVNLTANASISITGTNSSYFTASTYEVAKVGTTISATVITVTYDPGATGSHSATLTVSSTGAESQTVSLSGTGTAPQYTLTLTANPVAGGEASAVATKLVNGGTTTITATPNSHYTFNSWTIVSGTGASVTSTTTNPTTFTMGSTAAEVRANFDAEAKIAVTWKANGTTLTGVALGSATTEVFSGDKVTACPPDPSDLSGDCTAEFVGWAPESSDPHALSISTTTSTGSITNFFTSSTIASSPTITSAITFIAIYRQEQ